MAAFSSGHKSVTTKDKIYDIIVLISPSGSPKQRKSAMETLVADM